MERNYKYSTVPLEDPTSLPPAHAADFSGAASETPTSDDANSTQRRARVEKITNIMHSAVLCGLAGFLLYYTDMWLVLTTDPRLNRTPFYIALACVTGVMIIFVYATAVLPFVASRPVNEHLSHTSPIVQVATALGVTSYVCFVIALWPVWRFVTLILVLVIYMAFLLAPNILFCCF